MKQHMASGLRIAKYLEQHPRVERVIYPPLESHPQHALYKKQMSGFSGMISMYLKGDEVDKSRRFLNHLKVTHAGSVDQLHPAFVLFSSVVYNSRITRWLRIAGGTSGGDDARERSRRAPPSAGHHRWSHSYLGRLRRRARFDQRYRSVARIRLLEQGREVKTKRLLASNKSFLHSAFSDSDACIFIIKDSLLDRMRRTCREAKHLDVFRPSFQANIPS